MRIENCTSCKKDHADISVSQHTASNGRPYVRYTCPETSKTVTRFVSGATKPHATGGKAPAKKAADSASGHAQSGGPGNDVQQHVDVNITTPAPKAPRSSRGSGATPAPSGGRMQRTVTLDAETVMQVIPASGWDVCVGFIERLQEVGIGTPSLPSLLARADAAALQAHAAPSTQGRKDAKEHQVGRDLADIFVLVLASQRMGPADFGGLYPRQMAEAWSADPSAFTSGPGGTAGGARPSGGGAGGRPAGGLTVDDIMGPQGTQGQAAAAVVEEPAQGGGESVGNQVADGVSVMGGALAGGRLGGTLGSYFGPEGAAIGAVLGTVGGGIAGEKGMDKVQQYLFPVTVEPAQ